MLNLYKTLVRPHVEYGSSAWNLYYKKDKELLEQIQHRYTKMITDMRDKIYENRLKCLRLWTLEECRDRQDLKKVFKMYKGYHFVMLQELFVLDANSKDTRGTRGHSCKLIKARCTMDTARYFFSNKVINRWHVLEQSAVNTSSINVFKNSLEKFRSNWVGFFMD